MDPKITNKHRDTSLFFKIKANQEYPTQMCREHATAPATISEVHDRYKTVVENSSAVQTTPLLPKAHLQFRLTPADVDTQTNLIKNSLGETTARRAAELAALVSAAPDPDNSIAETFDPIIKRAEQRAIHHMDNSSNNKKR